MITTNLFTNHFTTSVFMASVYDKRPAEVTALKTKQPQYEVIVGKTVLEAMKPYGHKYGSAFYKSCAKFSPQVTASVQQDEELIGFACINGSSPYMIAFIGKADLTSFRSMMYVKQGKKYATLETSLDAAKKAPNGSGFIYTFNYFSSRRSTTQARITMPAQDIIASQAQPVEQVETFTREQVEAMIQEATAPLTQRIAELEAINATVQTIELMTPEDFNHDRDQEQHDFEVSPEDMDSHEPMYMMEEFEHDEAAESELPAPTVSMEKLMSQAKEVETVVAPEVQAEPEYAPDPAVVAMLARMNNKRDYNSYYKSQEYENFRAEIAARDLMIVNQYAA